jgi:membrane-bound ClpP family serine protease
MSGSSISPSLFFILLTTVCCIFPPIILFIGSIRLVPEGKRLQLFRLGRYAGERGPGLVILIPIVEKGIIINVLDQMNKVKNQFDFSGITGKAITPVFLQGSVLIDNEPWEAISKEPISAGEKIRIVGIKVEVERIPPFSY